MSTTDLSQFPAIAFIGGGNMASAIIGGLIRQGLPQDRIQVVEPYAPQRQALQQQFGISALPAADSSLAQAQVFVWAVKPQTFAEAAAAVADYSRHALHLSVAAGIRSDSIAQWLGNDQIVRAMPNTPALVGQGMTGLFARPQVSAAQQQLAEQIIRTTGQLLWVQQESQLDAVTALSGSGPAYVFYFLEAMQQAGVEMGLPADQALQLAIGTFSGASALAAQSPESPSVLRERVTSKGGTTFAALEHMRGADIAAHFVGAMHAAERRAKALGDEFGG
ncbi:pyrroline-5-carboxylate reductase [Comamonas piscis]|uniref:Pyrroline-5-carboxylate reductase n=1 Tax=Comamonas piscis TaxID=1562974 RepID=A0A7G5EN74_9BURK|nr:pyrroline-5-carboxylate reductase [Comamonas piscis]QMV75449.1 pyrroline-5-carboxylate reductase [Comamonas piscis]WSO33955.1 pyrroline-5-carboxylate reductase [Comamonas piscis]